MKVIYFLTILLLVGCSIEPKHSETPTVNTQNRGYNEINAEVSRLMSINAFDELDHLEESLRAENAISPSGWPLLFLFYQSFTEYPSLSYARRKELTHFGSQAYELLDKHPSSHLGHFLNVHLLIKAAFVARGYGYSHTVTKERWKIFHSYIDRANEYLELHKAELAENPYWYEQKLEIANFRGWPDDEYDAIFSEALSKHGYYMPILVTSVYHWTPKWGGSYSQMTEFILKSTAKIPFPLSDEIYARQYTYAIRFNLYPDLASSGVDCNRWLIGHAEITKKYPAIDNHNHAAYAATLCGNKAVAKEYFSLIGDTKPNLSYWKTLEAFDKARAWALEN